MEFSIGYNPDSVNTTQILLLWSKKYLIYNYKNYKAPCSGRSSICVAAETGLITGTP